MKIIGLLGGVASGKSMVAGQLASFGARILNADEIGHEVLHRPEIEADVRKRWGEKVLAADGRIDHGRLARIVFAPPPGGSDDRAYLEHLIHPPVIQTIKERLEQFASSAVEMAVIDAPLLVEAGLNELCDKLVFVDAPPAVRLARAVGRGWRKEDFEAREGCQLSLDFKRSRADVVIDNSGSSEQTQAQVRRLWSTLIR
jgi:dephospho-CoA kinase